MSLRESSQVTKQMRKQQKRSLTNGKKIHDQMLHVNVLTLNVQFSTKYYEAFTKAKTTTKTPQRPFNLPNHTHI